MAFSAQHFDRLRLRHLRLLDLIERNQSLRAVAEALGMTQPAVSQMVKDLEFAFDTALVDRSVKGAQLTAAGRHALNRARAGLATFDHLAGELLAEQPPTLRVACNPAVTYRLLPEAMKEIYSSAANLRVSVAAGGVGDMMKQLLAGVHDCYVGRVDWDYVPEGMAPLLRTTPLAMTELTVACATSHPLTRQKTVSARDLLEQPWVLSAGQTNNRMAIEAAFRNLGLPPPDPMVEMTADPNAMIAFASQMHVLICVPRIALSALPTSAGIVELPASELKLRAIQTSLLTLSESENLPMLKVFREALLNAARNGPRYQSAAV